MKSRKWKSALLCASFALCSYAALAQSPDTAPPGPPPGGGRHGEFRRGMEPERQLQRMTHLLTLSSEQQTGVKALLVEQDSQIRTLRNQQPADSAETQSAEARTAMRTRFDLIRNETNTKITALLDENQKKTFADWQAQRKAEMARRQGGVPPLEQPNQ